jgi:hypothetical protein
MNSIRIWLSDMNLDLVKDLKNKLAENYVKENVNVYLKEQKTESMSGHWSSEYSLIFTKPDEEDILMSGLHEFIKEIMSDIDENYEDGDFRFDLLRWSKDQPYWCVFACEHKENTAVTSIIEGTIGIGGHYCIGTDERLHDVLSILADSGWKVEIHPYYFDK